MKLFWRLRENSLAENRTGVSIIPLLNSFSLSADSPSIEEYEVWQIGILWYLSHMARSSALLHEVILSITSTNLH